MNFARISGLPISRGLVSEQLIVICNVITIVVCGSVVHVDLGFEELWCEGDKKMVLVNINKQLGTDPQLLA